MATRLMGAFRLSKARSAISAAMFAATPQLSWLSSVTTSRPVLRTEASRVPVSSGSSVRGSTTSADMPSFARASAAVTARGTCTPAATMVTSLPSRATNAFPNSVSYSSSGTGPRSLSSLSWAKNMVGSWLLRSAVRSSPLASAGVAGMATWRPGVFQYQGWGLPECCTPPPPRIP